MTATASTEPAAQSIADIAATNDSFDILVAALDAAGLVPTFSNPGDFTVFAPTDDAVKTLATEASNGVVQVIDRVLLPIDVADAMVKPTTVDTAIGATPEFEALVQAVVALDLVDTLSDRDANLTVFAPTDDAFRALADVVGIDTSTITSDGDLAGALVDELGADLVEQVVLYHVADGSYAIDALSEQQGIVTLEGGVLGATAGRVVDAAPGVASAR